MAVVKRAVIVLLVAAVLVAVKLLLANDKEENSAREPLPIQYDVGKWGHVDLPNGFRLSLPKGWEHWRKYQRLDGFIFRRTEKVDGFMPNVHVYWKRDNRPLDDWLDLQRSKRQGGGSKILGEGNVFTARMRGVYLIYETESARKDGTKIVTVTKDWLFGTDAQKGILRGISTARTFTEPYHAIFNEVHRRLRRN